MENSSRSRGIYQRFINFIRRKLNQPSGTEVPIEEGIISKTNGFMGSEVVVEFRHVDGSEILTKINDRTILLKKERNVTINGSDGEGEGEGERERTKKKESHEDMKQKHKRVMKPLLPIYSNINDKCDEYIRRRREEMEESYYQKQ